MTSTYRKLILILMAVLLIGSAAAAVTVTGKVTNATTGKPASGDTVELRASNTAARCVFDTLGSADGYVAGFFTSLMSLKTMPGARSAV